jgi:uncharacterized OsmC-like protein
MRWVFAECVTGTGTKGCAPGTMGHQQITQEQQARKPSRRSTTRAATPTRHQVQANISPAGNGPRNREAPADNRVAIAYQHCQKRHLVRTPLSRHNAARQIRRKERTMEASKFRAAQEPHKERYRKDAKAALLTLKAKGTADDSTVTCKIETGRGLAVAGIHPKCGGSGLELCSGDLLLEALIACAGVSLKAAASVLDIPVKSATISAEGDVDLRGTLGITDGVPVGFKEIRLHFDVETDAPQSDLAQLLEVTERYCVIFQTIQNSPNTKARMSVVRD